MNTVLIEFAGLCIGVTEANRTRVLLPHTRSVGGPSHTPVLLIRDHIGLIGTPHFTITLGGDLDEYAGWYLSGRMRMFGLKEPYVQPDTSQPKGKPPKEWKSLQYLASLGSIANADQLEDPAILPLAAEVLIEHGKLEPVGFSDQFAYNYLYQEALGEPEKAVYPAPVLRAERAAVRLSEVSNSFKIAFATPSGGQEIVTVAPSVGANIVVSNLTAASAQFVHHLDTYYECVKGTRRPRVKRYLADGSGARTRPDEPHNPDECVFAWFDQRSNDT